MDRNELIKWATDTVSEAAGFELSEDGREWLARHFGASADRVAGRPKLFQRFEGDFREKLKTIAQVASVLAFDEGSDAINASILGRAMKATNSQVTLLTSLCDPPPDGR